MPVSVVLPKSSLVSTNAAMRDCKTEWDNERRWYAAAARFRSTDIASSVMSSHIRMSSKEILASVTHNVTGVMQ